MPVGWDESRDEVSTHIKQGTDSAPLGKGDCCVGCWTLRVGGLRWIYEVSMADEMYFEDFYIGQKIHSAGSARVSAEEIKEFAQKYDPQPFHLDEAAGEGSFFKGLAASGWLTAAIVMRLRVESIKVFGGMIGAGVEEMRWTLPVRPNDTIRTEIEVVGARLSSSRKDYGIVRTRTLAYNQKDEVVLRSTVNFLAPLRGVL